MTQQPSEPGPWMIAVELPESMTGDRSRAAFAEYHKWLAGRGLDKFAIPDKAIRLDMIYMGPGEGCAVRISVLESALKAAQEAAGSPPPPGG